eukprot:1081091-Pleurochrysis_carterae.AAC.2
MKQQDGSHDYTRLDGRAHGRVDGRARVSRASSCAYAPLRVTDAVSSSPFCMAHEGSCGQAEASQVSFARLQKKQKSRRVATVVSLALIANGPHHN